MDKTQVLNNLGSLLILKFYIDTCIANNNVIFQYTYKYTWINMKKQSATHIISHLWI